MAKKTTCPISRAEFVGNAKPVTVQIGHIGAVTAYTFAAGPGQPDGFPNKLTSEFATLSQSTGKLAFV